MSATPGPWRHVTCQRPNGGDPWEVVYDNQNYLMAEFYGKDGLNAANARLAAAAPDFLYHAPRAVEMLRIAALVLREWASDARVRYDDADCDGSCVADDCEFAAEAIAAAIAKAEGAE